MVSKACSLFWYPFTQHRGLAHEDVAVVDSAFGDAYSLEGANGQRTQLFDAAASWWTQVRHTCHASQYKDTHILHHHPSAHIYAS